VQPEVGEVRERMANAISTVLGQAGAMVTRWVVLADVIEPDGERALWTLAPTDAKAWDTLGMLDYARAIKHGDVTAEAIRDEA
jgi:hypothetical protein